MTSSTLQKGKQARLAGEMNPAQICLCLQPEPTRPEQGRSQTDSHFYQTTLHFLDLLSRQQSEIGALTACKSFKDKRNVLEGHRHRKQNCRIKDVARATTTRQA